MRYEIMNQSLPIFVPTCNSLTRLDQIEPFLFLQTLQSSACMLVHQQAAIHFSADLTPVIFGFYMVQQQQMGKWENLIRNKKMPFFS